MKKDLITIVATAFLLAFGGIAQAGLINGSFETGDLTGWTDGGNLSWNSVSSGGSDGDGFEIQDGAVGSPSFLTQTFATIPGEIYDLGIWTKNDGTGFVQLRWNTLPNGKGGSVAVMDAFTAHDYALFTKSMAATSASTSISIRAQDDPGFVHFDEITAEDSGRQTPEPATMSLIGLSLLAIGPIAMKLRRKA